MCGCKQGTCPGKCASHMDPKAIKAKYVKHQHEWVYEGRSVAGWGIARCRICPRWDIY